MTDEAIHARDKPFRTYVNAQEHTALLILSAESHVKVAEGMRAFLQGWLDHDPHALALLKKYAQPK